VAQSRRRNRDVEEPLDKGVDATADTDALDEDVTDEDDLDEDEDALDEADSDADTDAGDDEDADDRKARKAKKAKVKKDDKVDVDLDERGPGIFGRFIRFVREVVAELRKVIWPTRKDLLVYAGVVIVFVAVMLALVGTLDWAFARAVLWVFSGN
jgi:preprotein translocase subunit SecE